ncbi:MAG: TIGR02147 family protein [Fibrobacterales bacterium]
MISVYDYSDYRKYLSDLQAMKSAQNRTFSYRYYAQKADINSSSFYPQVIKGKRNLTKETILKTCIAFGLDDDEAEYFENLVSFNQAKSVKAQNVFFEKMIEKQKMRHVKTISEEQYEYFSAWYHSAIREAVTLLDFKEDYGLLGKFLKPAISAKQAKASVVLLIKLGFLKRIEGTYQQTEPLLNAKQTSNLGAHQVINYQVEMLQMAITAFDRWKPKKRLSSATTLSFSKESYKSYIDIIRDCRSRLMKLAVNDQNPEQVYMLNINFFPLSNTLEG